MNTERMQQLLEECTWNLKVVGEAINKMVEESRRCDSCFKDYNLLWKFDDKGNKLGTLCSKCFYE